jgi:hypothetical protein
MWKSLKRWPVLIALLVASGALALACLPYGSRVTRANCERVRKGMAMEEVGAILGKPWDDSLLDPEGPDDSDGLVDWIVPVPLDPQRRYPVNRTRIWMGDKIGLFVTFDDEARVVSAALVTDPDRPRTWLPARVWRRLRGRYGW